MFTSSLKCFDAYNIHLKMPSLDELTNSSVSSTMPKLFTPAYFTDMCRNLDAYQKALVCLKTILSKCTTDMPLQVENYRKTQEYACANLDKFNITCMYEMTSKIVDCSSTVGYLTTSDYINLNLTEFEHKTTCMSDKLTPVCAQRYLSACGEVAVHVYKAYQANNTECLQPNLKSSSTDDIPNSYHQCFAYNGIPFQFPENLTSEDTSLYIMNAITTDGNLCSNLKAYQQALTCTLHVQKQCSDDAMKPTVADSQTVQGGLAKLCGHIGDFDTKCIQNAPKGTCSSRHSALDAKHLCAATSATQNCLVSAVSGCSKTTSACTRTSYLANPRPCV